MVMEKVRSEMIAAMKAGDKERKETLTMLLAALTSKEKEKRAPLTEEEEIAALNREMKQTKETMDTAPAERFDVVAKCRARISVIEEFLPKQLSEAEIKTIIENVLGSLGITKPENKDKGAIMKELMPQVKGKADGKLVNTLLMAYFV